MNGLLIYINLIKMNEIMLYDKMDSTRKSFITLAFLLAFCVSLSEVRNHNLFPFSISTESNESISSYSFHSDFSLNQFYFHIFDLLHTKLFLCPCIVCVCM